MSDTAATTWFYTHEGEKIGPVTFGYLQAKAKEGGINPRLDMAWTQGMEEWKHAGDIEGLFERASAPVEQESLAPSANPYTPPGEESIEDRMAQESDWPGARRRSFIFATLIFPGLCGAAIGAGTAFLNEKLGAEMAAYAVIGANALPLLVAVYFGIQRLANLGMSRWWYLGNFVPLLNFWVGYRCFVCPAGDAFHKKLDGIGIFLAIIYWLMLLLVLAIVGVVVAAFMGAINDPEIQEPIREIFRNLDSALKAPPAP